MERVLLIGLNYAPDRTGIPPYTTGAAEGLAGQGAEVRVITGYPHYPSWKIPPDYRGLTMREEIEGVPVLRLRHPVPADGNPLVRVAMELVFGLRAVFSGWGRPSVVLAVSPALLSTALVVARARLTGVPVVVWVQDIYTLGVTETGAGGFGSRPLRAVESWTMRSATRVIGIHQRFKRFLTEQLGVAEDRVDVVRNWTHVPASRGRSEETRVRLGWNPDHTIVLHAGNMGAKQNLQSVVRASRIAAEQEAPVTFVLLGDGHRKSELVAMGSNSRLQFLDPLPDGEFESALASADVLLVNELPGMTEMSVPSKLTSYFSTGLPVLAAVDPGSVTAEEIESSGGGRCVAADDPEALLAAALALREGDLAAGLGAAGLRYQTTELGSAAAMDRLRASLARAAAR